MGVGVAEGLATGLVGAEHPAVNNRGQENGCEKLHQGISKNPDGEFSFFVI